jgi:predicted nucleic acid-binding protein
VISYAESSAVLAWLLGEPSGALTREVLSRSDRVVSSAITAVECARGLARARQTGRLPRAEELAALRLLDVAESSWDLHSVSDRVLARARTGFPAEPVRTLDAIHLATAGLLHGELGGVTMVTLDERIRGNALGLGMEVLPE